MSARPGLSLIINTFNQPEYLARVLRAVSNQRSRPEEVLVADDGSGRETRAVFQEWAGRETVTTRHVWQPHEGFRRARILNQAIAAATQPYVVFLDGDTVPHPDFLADHRRLARPGAFIQGHRALVQEQGAANFGRGEFRCDRRQAMWRGQIRGVKHAFRWPRPLLRRRGDLEGIRGCNLGIWREDLLRVNGYNEAFEGWGREDSELAVRLMNCGIERFDARGWALCFHLWHPPAPRERLPANDDLLERAIREKATRCARGLDQYLSPSAP